MKTRLLVLSLLAVLILTVYVPVSKAAITNPPGPYEYVVATIGSPQTVDPALAYDSASGELIFNVYETLVTFDKESLSSLLPMLADSWTLSPDGQTYTFHIRSGVQWQDPTYGMLKPSDVEYSFERLMVRDYTGGPAWMFWEPIFGNFSADLTNPVACGQKIDAAITSDDVAGTVTIQFATGYAYAPFMSILTQTWTSVLSRDWAIAQGDWPGTGLQDGSWVAYHDPAYSPFDWPSSKMMGTGPYKLDYFISTSWSIVKFDNYWGGWGNPRRGFASRGYLTRMTELFISDWPTRFAGFTGGTPIYDNIYVPRAYIAQVWQQPGVQCIYPLTAISVDALFFNHNIRPYSQLIGNGQWGELGIIPTFFSDVHVRRAMAYSFNWTKYIIDAYMGEAKQNAIPVPDTLQFFNASLPKYGINIPMAVEEWKLAWGGDSTSPGLAWTQGFRFTYVYNAGDVLRMILGQILKANVEAENPKFHIDLLEQFFEPTIPYDERPVYKMGWLGDYADVHTYAAAFMSGYSSEMDRLIEWGVRNTTDAGRRASYNQLWQLYVQQAPNVPLVQVLNRHWEREWVNGWYYNAFYPGTYAYSMWKEDMYASSGQFMGKHANWEDINEDGKVDTKDLAAVAKGFGNFYIQSILPPYPPPPPWYSPGWNSRCDVNVVNVVTGARGDMKIDIRDAAAIAKLFGFVADPWQPPP